MFNARVVAVGKERDAETAGSSSQGLDFFGARYYSAAQGRFTSPDPLGAGAGKVEDPQSWNLYAYARNNPLLYTDPDGMKFRRQKRAGAERGQPDLRWISVTPPIEFL